MTARSKHCTVTASWVASQSDCKRSFHFILGAMSPSAEQDVKAMDVFLQPFKGLYTSGDMTYSFTGSVYSVAMSCWPTGQFYNSESGYAVLY